MLMSQKEPKNHNNKKIVVLQWYLLFIVFHFSRSTKILDCFSVKQLRWTIIALVYTNMYQNKDNRIPLNEEICFMIEERHLMLNKISLDIIDT